MGVDPVAGTYHAGRCCPQIFDEGENGVDGGRWVLARMCWTSDIEANSEAGNCGDIINLASSLNACCCAGVRDLPVHPHVNTHITSSSGLSSIVDSLRNNLGKGCSVGRGPEARVIPLIHKV